MVEKNIDVQSMKNLRIYGFAPYKLAVIHGGPGAAGEMAPVANELASEHGVLEPLQNAESLLGQIDELRMCLERHAHLPVTLIGFSWGAWLSYLVAAQYPSMIKKLILVGSAPFLEKHIASLHQTRLNRLDKDEKKEFDIILKRLENPSTKMKDVILARLGALTSKTDTYEPMIDESIKTTSVKINGEIFQRVFQEAADLRKSGQLLEYGKQIACPVVAIHGDYDPHPAEGVREPLSNILNDFRFILLNNCGHTPWIERQAKEKFYKILKDEFYGRYDNCLS